LAPGGKVADPGGHLADLIVRGQGQLGAVGVGDGDWFGGAQGLDPLVRVAAAQFGVGGDGQVAGVLGGVFPLQPVLHGLREGGLLLPVVVVHRPVAGG